MAIRAPRVAGSVAWQPVLTGDEAVAVAERATARVGRRA